MAIVGAFDVHRAQLTYDYLDTDTGEVRTGQVRPGTRAALREFLARFEDGGAVAFAVEGCTGWRFVTEELERAGITAHLAEPADTATLRGRKKRAKTDRADARHLRELLAQDRIPESWIPPAHVLEVRTIGRLYVALMDERRAWQQRIHAQLFHQGVPKPAGLLVEGGRVLLEDAELSPAGRQWVDVAFAQIDSLTDQVLSIRAQLAQIAHRQAGCRALMGRYGIGSLTAPVVWAEMGDTRRFSSSDKAVRHAGLDVTIYSSDSKRAPGRLARQGPAALRWALYEAALCASRPGSPDHEYYLAAKQRLGGKEPMLSVARKLARWCHHTLRTLGDEAWGPIAERAVKKQAA
jgi:transposase